MAFRMKQWYYSIGFIGKCKICNIRNALNKYAICKKCYDPNFKNSKK